jgi:hypothetical protein
MSDESKKVARLIKLVFAVALGLVTEVVRIVKPSWARAGAIAFTKKLAGYLLIYDSKRIEDAAVVVPALTVFLFSWAILSVPELWDLLKKTPSFLAQHIFAKFPSELFQPIRAAHAWDPLWDMNLNPKEAPDRALPWRRPLSRSKAHPSKRRRASKTNNLWSFSRSSTPAT